MKRLILVIVAVALMNAGCHGVQRTGTICVVPFTTAKFKTTNPIDVKQDAVDAIRDLLMTAIKSKIEEESYFKVADDCTKSDYELTGRLHTLNTAMQGSGGRSFFFGGNWSYSERSFGIGYACTVKNIKTGKTVMSRDDFMHRGKVDSNLDSIGGDIVEDLMKISE